MPEMRLLFVSLALAGLGWMAVAQDTPKSPSPLVFNGEFLRDTRTGDVEALSAAIRLELEGDPKAAQRNEYLPALIRTTERALQADRHNLGWVFGARLLAFLRGAQWGPALDLAISLKFELDRGVIAPGGLLRVRLERIFSSKDSAQEQLQFALKDSSGQTLWKGEPMSVPPEDPIEVALPVRSLPEGAYTAVYSLLAGGRDPLVAGTRTFRIDAGWRQRELALNQAARSIALKELPESGARATAALRFVEWTARAMAAQAAGEPVDGAAEPHPAIETWASHKAPRFWSVPLTAADAERAESYVRQLQSGANALAGGEDLRLAFSSDADQSLRTFRLLLPSTLPPSEPVPLVVVLHGFAGDESSWLDMLPGAGIVLRRHARDRRFAVLAPSARSRYSRFDGPDAADLEQLRKLVSRIRPIDPARVALIGHGPAAFAAINLALASPTTWPIAVGVAGLPKGLPVAKPDSRPRLLFEFAAGDKLFPASEARKWAYLLEKRIPGFTSKELPGVDNAQAPAASIERAIAFILESPPKSTTIPEAARK